MRAERLQARILEPWSQAARSFNITSRSRRMGGAPWRSISLWNFSRVNFAPSCLPVVLAQLQNLQLAERVVEVFGIIGPADRFLPRGLLLVIAVVLKEPRRLLNAHALAMHLDRDAQPAYPQQRLVGLRQPVFGRLDLFRSRRSSATRSRRSLHPPSSARCNAPSLR